MASPEELKLEQKAKALQLKEDALTRQAQTQIRTETRLTSTQQEVAQKERANQLKIQELKAREQKLEEDKRLVIKEAGSLATRQTEFEAKKKTANLIILPMLLIVCIVGGYLAFDYMNQQKLQYNQIVLASKNIDKLANILSITQEEVLDKTSSLQNKKVELDKTKSMLVDLKTTSDQLQTEIIKLQDNQPTSDTEKNALTSSAEMIVSQLSDLKIQLEDNYLTNDINEAFIDYQENDLKVFKEALTDYQKQLVQKEGSLTKQQANQELLEKRLTISKKQNNKLSDELNDLNDSLNEIQSQLKNIAKENKVLEKQNINLSRELNKLKEEH
tara:strand:- start:4493 stop:5482 length:990 start_codon:yes stop_codon:yes gene_type:complete